MSFRHWGYCKVRPQKLVCPKRDRDFDNLQYEVKDSMAASQALTMSDLGHHP